MKKLLFFASIVCLALVGCSSNENVSSSELKKSLNKELLKQCLVVYPIDNRDVPFPIEIDKKDVKTALMLDTYVKAGLIQAKETSIVKTSIFGSTSTEEGYAYTLTKEGEKYHNSSNTRGGFCIGNLVVNEVIDFTIPTQVGAFVTEVEFSTKVDNLPKWTKDIPNIKELLEGNNGRVQKRVMYLKNSGWSLDRPSFL